MRWVALGLGISLVTGSLVAADKDTRSVVVGFSFSPYAATYRALSPTTSLSALLAALSPNVVRLPVYWTDVSPKPAATDFSVTDSLLDVVRQHNAVAAIPTAVILTVGARNFGYPEVWAPAWFDNLAITTSDMETMPAYDLYLRATISRYAGEPLLSAWQVENEPFDDVQGNREAEDELAGDLIAREIDEVKAIDPHHRVVVTTFDSSTVDLDELAIDSPGAQAPAGGPQPAGHPEQALDSNADVLGLDAYVVTVNTPLRDASAMQRIDWKANALRFWNQRAQSKNKSLWLTEMQAESSPDAEPFTPADLLYSARAYHEAGISVVMMWGVESWLLSTSWMSAGMAAINTLRSAAH